MQNNLIKTNVFQHYEKMVIHYDTKNLLPVRIPENCETSRANQVIKKLYQQIWMISGNYLINVFILVMRMRNYGHAIFMTLIKKFFLSSKLHNYISRRKHLMGIIKTPLENFNFNTSSEYALKTLNIVQTTHFSSRFLRLFYLVYHFIFWLNFLVET